MLTFIIILINLFSHGGNEMKKFIIPAEVYSRVSGYFRPVVQWNKGKQAEFNDRKMLEFQNEIVKIKSLKISDK